MDNKDLLNALGGAGEEYVKEAEPQEMMASARARKKPAVWVSAATVCVVIAVLVLTGVLSGRRNGNVTAQVKDPSEQESGAAAASNTADSSKANSNVASSSTAAPDTDRILFRGNGITVKDITGLPADSSAPTEEACLAYYTDKELADGADVVLRGRLTGRKIVEITNEKSDFPQYASVLTVEPVRVLKGELKTEGPVRVFVLQSGPNTSTYGTDWSLQNASAGREGILLLHDFDPFFEARWGSFSDYDGWASCFAVWERDGHIALPKYYYSSFDPEWTLDRAEARMQVLLGGGPELPADFAFSVDYRYEGEDRIHDQGYTYDSVSGRMEEILSFADDLRMRTAVFDMEESDRKLFYDCLERLNDFPEETVHEKGEYGEIFRLDLRWQADGEQHHVRYQGGALGYGNSFSRQMGTLLGAVQEMQHIFEQCREKYVDVRHAEMLPYSREGYAQMQKENRKTNDGPETAERPEPGDVLYDDETVTVRVMTESGTQAPQEEACLVYLTEYELFTGGLTVMAELTDAVDVEIERKEEAAASGLEFLSYPGRATILTLKPVETLYGTLPDDGPIRVLVDQCLNTSLENRGISRASGWIGCKGIFMLYPVTPPPEGEESLRWRSELADYTVGDNVRFAIWANPGGGLSYPQSAFPGLYKTWTLDQAADYVRKVIAP